MAPDVSQRLASPPATPASVVPKAAEQPLTQPLDQTGLLDQLVASGDGVISAILASVDGFGLARSATMTDEASHSAMLAAVVGLAHQLVAMGGGNQLCQLIVDHDAGRLLVWPIGTDRVLAVLATTSVDQGPLRQFVQGHLTELVGGAT